MDSPYVDVSCMRVWWELDWE